MEDKNIIRRKILNKRNKLDKNFVISYSEEVINKLTCLDEYKKSDTIMSYMSFKNEVDTFNLIEKMLDENKKVIVPYTDINKVEIIPVEIKDIEDNLTYSRYGYLEPKKEIIKPVDIKEIDLILVPGVVFDKNCNRIGFGKGYYDKLLVNRRKDTFIIALAYEFQVANMIPAKKHDIKMDMIITEESIYKSPV